MTLDEEKEFHSKEPNCTQCGITLGEASTTHRRAFNNYTHKVGRLCDICQSMYFAIRRQSGLARASELYWRETDALAAKKRNLLRG